MRFSVLMSLYARERPEFLRESLNSVFSQTLKADEVVLMEDGPLTPELYSVVEEYALAHKELRVIVIPVNGGLGNALNVGLGYCTNELVARMDTDDICSHDRFEKQVRFMTENPDIDVCSATIDEFAGCKENIVRKKTLPTHHEDIYEYGKTRCPINHPAVIYRKSKVIAAGGYGPFPEDYYLWGRMLAAGFKFHNIRESLLLFRSSPDVFKRRGGWHYCKSVISLQRFLHNIGYISIPVFVKNIVIRSAVSMLPNSVRAKIYETMLRSR